MTDDANRDEKGRWLTGHAEAGPGRESLYDPSMNDMARKLALLGLIDEEIARFFGIDVRTFHRWKEEHPAFRHSLIEGKTMADAEVADSLYKRAIGQSVVMERAFKKSDGTVEIVKLSTFIPGDPGAAKLWLTNRTLRNARPWRDRQTVEIDDARPMEHMTDAELEEIARERRPADPAPAGDPSKVH